MFVIAYAEGTIQAGDHVFYTPTHLATQHFRTQQWKLYFHDIRF